MSCWRGLVRLPPSHLAISLPSILQLASPWRVSCCGVRACGQESGWASCWETRGRLLISATRAWRLPLPFAGAITSCGAVFQALAGAYLIKRCCGASNPFNELRQLFSFGGIVVITCLISASTGVTGLSLSGILAWETYGFTFLTWYLGDLMGAVLFVPLIITWPSLVGHVRDTHRSLETGVVLSLVVAFSLCVFCGYIPLQLAGNSLLLLTLPLVLWAAFRLAQPGVAILVNMIGLLAAFLTTQGSGPFATDNTHVALELLQLFMMVTMIAGLSLAIAIEQLRRSQSSFRTLRLAIDQAGDAVFLVRPDASFEYVNAQATTLLGYPAESPDVDGCV